MSQVDRALFLICVSWGFHSGYSLRIADEADRTKNLHLEYVNEQRAANPAAGSPNRS